MKKLFALALCLCLLCGCTALADTEITWEQVAPVLEEQGITGGFYTFEQIAIAIFIPDGMVEAELPNENSIGCFTDADGSGSTVTVLYVNADGMDLETYTAALPVAGATEIETGTVNGLPCVSYEMPSNGTLNVAFTTEAGYILEVVCGPVTTDEEKLGASVILASIQSAE